ncbi:hypothetical protein ACLFMI_03810 [Pseudonocardia nantongensis]|uniref:hypothetical protein n=1 Tax=Pseudonocardia nantongensis TaxID=1181885 RepID=UPI00397A775F
MSTGNTPTGHTPTGSAPTGAADTPEPERGTGRRARRGADTDGGSTWLQDEIRRRVADGAGGSGRHARVDPAAGGGTAAPDAPARPDEQDETTPATPATPVAPTGPAAPAGSATSAAPVGPAGSSAPPAAPAGPAPAGHAPAGPAPVDDPDDDAPALPVRRPRPARPRPDVVPDPYAPEGLRPGGSAARPTGPGPSDTGKQWPPAPGSSAGLPRRTPGATSWPAPSPAPSSVPSPSPSSSWEVDRAALLGGPAAAAPATPSEPAEAEAPPETRPVPTRWTATGRRAPAVPDTAFPAPAVPGDPRRSDDPDGPGDGRDHHGPDHDDLDDDDLDEDDLDEDDLDDLDPHAELRGPAAERTEVLWRAPDLDDPPVAPAPAPEPGGPGPAPYTGARPRRFAAAPTDAPVAAEGAEPEAADEAGGGRVRIVLSERRSTAHSSRGLSDVQDPGPVGTLLRNSLVRNQLALALRVCVVALVGLGLPPALFVAFPVLGGLSVLGIRLPWLLLGGLVYPFLLGLGWWYVTSAEAVEQEFAEDVTDR